MSDSTNADFPTYYQRLSRYFPDEELKHPEHLEDLVDNQPVYHKIENDNYLLLYAEFSDFIFIDYLLVNSSTRGRGIGSKIMGKLKSLGKPIVLEVEPGNPENPDTVLRRKFYTRHGFKEAKEIAYQREDSEGNTFEMDILLWTPESQSVIKDKKALEMMSRVCEQIHNFRARKYYGRLPADPDEVLSLQAKLMN